MSRKSVMDDEPKLAGKIVSETELGAAYNWYNYNCDKEQAKKWTLQFLRDNNKTKEASILEKVKDENFSTLGWISRLRLNGAILPERTNTWAAEGVRQLVRKAKPETEEKKSAPKTSVQDHINEQVRDLIGDLDEMIDKSLVVDVYKWLQEKNVRGPQARKIFDSYQAFKKELIAALKGDDEEVNEYYKNIPKKRTKELLTMVEAIVDNCYLVAQNSKIARKPRAKKVKSAEKLVNKIKYLEKDDNLKVQSIPATNIVGASQLWVFNNKTRKLGVYAADEGGNLSIKGTTILGFDKKLSIHKKLRKPEKILPEVITGGRVALRKIMDNIKAKAAPLTGRINTDTLLLRAIK